MDIRTTKSTCRSSRWAGRVAAVLTAVVLTGCGISVPTDPQGTLDRVRDGEMRVGVSPEPGLVDVRGAEPSGPLPDLVHGFASEIGTEPEWTVASEESLVAMLEEDELDLVIGGFTDTTPWVEKAGTTRGYDTIPGADGRKLVLLVPLGENAFLTELEEYLDEEVGS